MTVATFEIVFIVRRDEDDMYRKSAGFYSEPAAEEVWRGRRIPACQFNGVEELDDVFFDFWPTAVLFDVVPKDDKMRR